MAQFFYSKPKKITYEKDKNVEPPMGGLSVRLSSLWY